MSSGFFGFFAHQGMLTAMLDAGLLPARVTGSSAGALVASGYASGLDPDAFRQVLFDLRRVDFWDPGPGLGVLRGRLFRSLLEETLPVASFETCSTPLAVTVFDLWSGRAQVLDSGPLAPAVHASCALPVMFQPVWIGGRPYLDGGVSDRPGLRGVDRQERTLYHHLVARSPWRRTRSRSLRLPRRPRTTSLRIEDLPRVGPFTLEQGPRAFEAALAATRRALEQPIEHSGVRVH